MSAKLLDGRATARHLRQETKQEVQAFVEATGQIPSLAVVQVGEDPASAWYVRQIEKSMARLGIAFRLDSLPEDAGPGNVAGLLKALNSDKQTHGIIVQMPLPKHLDASVVTDHLDPDKDVDGIHPLNAGRLAQNLPEALVPATPAGGMALLDHYDVPIQGAQAVVIGRSSVVGRPMAMLLLHRHATVSICHSRTADLAAVACQADILAVAVGRAGLVTADMVKPGAVVVDFGANVVDKGMVGDVSFEEVSRVAGMLTPVPGGTGPMTNVMLARNVLKAARRQLAID